MGKVIIDPWGSVLIKDYQDVLDKFNLEKFNLSLFPRPNRLMRRNVVFAGSDLNLIDNCIKNKKKYYALTGIMPSNEKIHLGTKAIIENLKYFQDNNALTYILIADLEALSTRGIKLKDSREYALNFHIPAYIALGLDIKKTVFYFQSDNKKVMNYAYDFSRKITLNEFRSIYGSTNPGRIMAAILQVADILYPQLNEKIPGIIPVGIDQRNHVQLARDIVARFKDYNFISPSALYCKFMPSLDGDVKMSKSKPESMIELPENINNVCKKIRKAVTGGRKTLEEHRKFGAVIENDMVFELLKQHLIEDDEELERIYLDYKIGKMNSNEIKELACEKITVFMNKFNSNLEKARDNMDKVRFLEF
jgi:tryptophanyl-tRNA synthetase